MPRQQSAMAVKRATLKFLASVRGKVRFEVGRNLTGAVLQPQTRELLRAVWRSIRIVQTGTWAGLEINTGTEYGTMWETKGRMGYFIVPTIKQALHFETKSGEEAFSKGHWIPFSAPKPFIKPAIAKLEPWARKKHPQFFLEVFPNIIIKV